MPADWDWESRAAAGKDMPAGLSLEDQAAYQAVSCLHWRFRHGLISQLQASKEKKQILSAYRRQRSEHEFLDRQLRHNAEMWKSIEAASSVYALEPSVEHADGLFQAVYGVQRTRPTAFAGRELNDAADDSGESSENGGT